MRSLCDHDERSFRCPFRFCHLQFSNPRRPASGDPRASSPTHRSPEERAASFATAALRPVLVDRALAMVARLALQSAHRSPSYSDRLASQSFRVVLDAEITTAPGETKRAGRNSRLDSEHERSEPVVGSTAHSRRTAQVRTRSRTIDRGQISSSPAKATVSNLAKLLDQSHGTDGLHRLLPGADGDLPTSVCVRGVVACAAPRTALSGDRTSQPGMDHAADTRGFSLGPRVRISSARPRCDVRR
jgi:hypothetical protein